MLDEHYVRPRYPDARTVVDLGYDQDTAQEAFEYAQTVLLFARTSIANVRNAVDNPTTADLG